MFCTGSAKKAPDSKVRGLCVRKVLRVVCEETKSAVQHGHPVVAVFDSHGNHVLPFGFHFQSGKLKVHFVKHGAGGRDFLNAEGDGFSVGRSERQ